MLDQTGLLLAIRALQSNNISVEAFYRQLTEIIAKQLNCSRAGLWLFSGPALTELVAVDIYVTTGQHYQGDVLYAAEYAAYFAQMRRAGNLVAPDVTQHPATLCLQQDYFIPLNIRSLLDVGIYYQQQLVGVFCCEQVAAIKKWQQTEIAFLEQTGKLITFALKPQLQQNFAKLFASKLLLE